MNRCHGCCCTPNTTRCDTVRSSATFCGGQHSLPPIVCAVEGLPVLCCDVVGTLWVSVRCDGDADTSWTTSRPDYCAVNCRCCWCSVQDCVVSESCSKADQIAQCQRCHQEQHQEAPHLGQSAGGSTSMKVNIKQRVELSTKGSTTRFFKREPTDFLPITTPQRG